MERRGSEESTSATAWYDLQGGAARCAILFRRNHCHPRHQVAPIPHPLRNIDNHQQHQHYPSFHRLPPPDHHDATLCSASGPAGLHSEEGHRGELRGYHSARRVADDRRPLTRRVNWVELKPTPQLLSPLLALPGEVEDERDAARADHVVVTEEMAPSLVRVTGQVSLVSEGGAASHLLDERAEGRGVDCLDGG